ncbi:MAG: hypothetical protein EXS38_07205 [Opitutus sp.]|nr:hypothetical protein [Opitutus sp.]
MESTELAVLIIARHRSASLALNDRMWGKYGTQLSARSGFVDPKTKAPPTANLFNSVEASKLLPSRGSTLDSLLKLGVQFGVCATAARAVAGVIGRSDGPEDR